MWERPRSDELSWILADLNGQFDRTVVGSPAVSGANCWPIRDVSGKQKEYAMTDEQQYNSGWYFSVQINT